MKRGIITIKNGVVGIPTAPVCMTQEEIADLFNVDGRDICKAINVIYKDGVLSEAETMQTATETIDRRKSNKLQKEQRTNRLNN